MTKKLLLMGMVVVLALVLATTAFAQEMAPSVTVEDQPIVDDSVTVAKVVAPQDGWMVIHAQKDGSIGPVIGHAPVTEGENVNVVVPIDTSAATETLYAMLHVDEGEKGAYEFPGPDGPVVVDGKPLAPAFMVTGGMGGPPETLPVTGASQVETTNSRALLWGMLGALLLLAVLGAGMLRRRGSQG